MLNIQVTFTQLLYKGDLFECETFKIYGSNREELYFYRIEKSQMSYDSFNDILFDFLQFSTVWTGEN